MSPIGIDREGAPSKCPTKWNCPRDAQRVLPQQCAGLRASFSALLFLYGSGISDLLPGKSKSIERACEGTSAKDASRCASRGQFHPSRQNRLNIRANYQLSCFRPRNEQNSAHRMSKFTCLTYIDSTLCKKACSSSQNWVIFLVKGSSLFRREAPHGHKQRRMPCQRNNFSRS